MKYITKGLRTTCLHVTGCGELGHMTSSLGVKMVHYDWKVEKTALLVDKPSLIFSHWDGSQTWFLHGAEIHLKIGQTLNPQCPVMLPYPLGCFQPGLDLWERRRYTDAGELSWGGLWSMGYFMQIGSCFLKRPRTIEVSFWKWNMESQNTHSGITSATIWVHFPHIPNDYQVPAKRLLSLPLLLFSTVNSPCYSSGPKWAEAAEIAGERSHSCKPMLFKKLHTGARDDQNFFQTTLNPILKDDAGGAWGCSFEQNMEPPSFSEGRKRGRLPSSSTS